MLKDIFSSCKRRRALYAAVCALLIAVSLCCSCGYADKNDGGGGDAPASDLVCAAIGSVPALDGTYSVYIPSAAPDGDGFLSDDALYRLYYGDDADSRSAGELDGVDDWCVALSRSPEQKELHVLHLRHRSAESPVLDMLRTRAGALSKPDLSPGGASPFGSRAPDVAVFVSGSFAVLCACSDCRSVMDWFDSVS